jgi:hypothetical protein
MAVARQLFCRITFMLPWTALLYKRFCVSESHWRVPTHEPQNVTSLAVDAVCPAALGGPRAGTASVVIDEPRCAGQDVGHSVNTVEELVANLCVRVPEVAVRPGTALAGLRVLWKRKHISGTDTEQARSTVTRLTNCEQTSSNFGRDPADSWDSLWIS